MRKSTRGEIHGNCYTSLVLDNIEVITNKLGPITYYYLIFKYNNAEYEIHISNNKTTAFMSLAYRFITFTKK